MQIAKCVVLLPFYLVQHVTGVLLSKKAICSTPYALCCENSSVQNAKRELHVKLLRADCNPRSAEES